MNETPYPHPLHPAHRGVGHCYLCGKCKREQFCDGAYLSLGAFYGIVGDTWCAHDFFPVEENFFSGRAENPFAFLLCNYPDWCIDDLPYKQKGNDALTHARTDISVCGGGDAEGTRLALHVDTRYVLHRLLSGHGGSGGLCEHSYE